jgi:predicted nuclease of predicted toxin-antitoxin system
MRFLVDAQLPPAFAARLRGKGHDCEHVYEIGLAAASDSEIWKYAIRRGAVLITKDQDFVDRAQGKTAGASVIWVRLGNTTNEGLWRSVEPLLPELLEALAAGERLIEIA